MSAAENATRTPLPIQDAIAMAKFLADSYARQTQLGITDKVVGLRPSADLDSVMAEVRLPQSTQERQSLRLYARVANAAYRYVREFYDILPVQ